MPKAPVSPNYEQAIKAKLIELQQLHLKNKPTIAAWRLRTGGVDPVRMKYRQDLARWERSCTAFTLATWRRVGDKMTLDLPLQNLYEAHMAQAVPAGRPRSIIR